MALLDIQNVPEVDQNSDPNSNNSQYAVYLRGPRKGHEGTGGKDPNPPIPGEVPVPLLIRQ